MEERDEQIKGGAFQVARKLFESEIWLDKPSSWFKIWVYILGKVNHKERGKFRRGEGFFQFQQERSLIGKDITSDVIKKAISYFKKNAMIGTKRSTRGMKIIVFKYNTYQSFDNYLGTEFGTKKALRKHSDTQELKNDKNNTETSVSPFDWNSYLEEMKKDKRLNIRLIALYFIKRKVKFDSHDEATEAIRRHLKDSVKVSKFDRDKIYKAIEVCENMKEVEWTLGTVLKVLTK